MRAFKIPQDPLGMGCHLYTTNQFTFEPGITVLVGCNGSGKSTLIRMMMEHLKKEGIPHLRFDNLTDGGAQARSKAGFYGDFTFLATSFCSSEGENIVMNMNQYAGEVGNLCRKFPDAKEMWFFFDAVDSGLSIDNVLELKEHFLYAVSDVYPDRDIYIIVSANAYEVACNERCLDVRRAKEIRFSSYEEYRNFILSSRKTKDNRGKRRKKKE